MQLKYDINNDKNIINYPIEVLFEASCDMLKYWRNRNASILDYGETVDAALLWLRSRNPEDLADYLTIAYTHTKLHKFISSIFNSDYSYIIDTIIIRERHDSKIFKECLFNRLCEYENKI